MNNERLSLPHALAHWEHCLAPFWVRQPVSQNEDVPPLKGQGAQRTVRTGLSLTLTPWSHFLCMEIRCLVCLQHPHVDRAVSRCPSSHQKCDDSLLEVNQVLNEGYRDLRVLSGLIMIRINKSNVRTLMMVVVGVKMCCWKYAAVSVSLLLPGSLTLV